MGFLQELRRAARDLGRPLTVDPPGEESGEDNSSVIERMRALVPDMDVELPNLDLSMEDGLYLQGSLGAVRMGEHEARGASVDARVGQWHDEHGVQTGAAVSGTLGEMTTPLGRAEIGHAETSVGAFEDEAGPRAGVHARVAAARLGSDESSRLNVLAMEGQSGLFQANDGLAVGARGDLQVAGVDDPVASGHVGHVNGNAWIGENGGALGGTANLVDDTIANGRAPNPNTVDHNASVGGSLGVGAQVRGRWGGDEDGDHLETIGGGFDAGPVSVDLSSEDPQSMIGDLSRGEDGHLIPRKEAGPKRRRVPFSPPLPDEAPGTMQAPVAPTRGLAPETREELVDALALRGGRPSSEFSHFGPDGRRVFHDRAVERQVRVCQREQGLPVTGELDAATSAALAR